MVVSSPIANASFEAMVVLFVGIGHGVGPQITAGFAVCDPQNATLIFYSRR